MIHQLLEESLQKAKHAFKEANSENVIEICGSYLVILKEFRRELLKFRGNPEINLQQADSSSSSREKAVAKRREIHLAITHTILELNQTTALLDRLTSISGYETVATLNRLNYKGHNNWECRGGKVRFKDGADIDQISIQEATDIAIGLRCDEFIHPTAV